MSQNGNLVPGSSSVSLGALGASEVHIGEVAEPRTVISANFTRPNDTTAYAANDLVANSATAASVAALSWALARTAAGALEIHRVRMKKSGTTVTNASFRLHLYGTDPAASTGIANGDNGAWSTKIASYLGSVDLDMSGTAGRVFTDASWVSAARSFGTDIIVKLASGQTVYGLLQALAAYTPTAQEVFTVEIEVRQA